MGFFSKLFTSEPVKLSITNEREAYASVLLACMFTDGSDSEEERMFFISMVSARFGYKEVEKVCQISVRRVSQALSAGIEKYEKWGVKWGWERGCRIRYPPPRTK